MVKTITNPFVTYLTREMFTAAFSEELNQARSGGIRSFVPFIDAEGEGFVVDGFRTYRMDSGA